MILTGRRIQEAVDLGDILIEPFDSAQLNPNSYNYRLGQELVEIRWTGGPDPERVRFSIPETGTLLQPRRLYLGATRERFATTKYAMTILGRSSLGRLGLFLNLSSDLGHIGSNNHWTLEMAVVQPLVVYPHMRVGQVVFWQVTGEVTEYLGRYLGDTEAAHSRDACTTLVGAYPA